MGREGSGWAERGAGGQGRGAGAAERHLGTALRQILSCFGVELAFGFLSGSTGRRRGNTWVSGRDLAVITEGGAEQAVLAAQSQAVDAGLPRGSSWTIQPPP